MSTLEHAAARLGLTTDQLIPYGRELAKLPLDLLESDRHLTCTPTKGSALARAVGTSKADRAVSMG
jgi:hypothetical protein